MPCRILPDVDFRRESYLNTLAGLATCGVGELFRESGVNDKGGGRGVLHAPTIRTVAQRAGVSVGTVSRVCLPPPAQEVAINSLEFINGMSAVI